MAFLAVLGASHGILDAMTDGGLGIALLAPFANTRYFLPWAPIPVAPIGLAAFFSKWGLEIIEWEMVYIWLPVCAAAAALTLTLGGRRRLRRAARSSSSRG